jgi:glutathione S-transferase
MKLFYIPGTCSLQAHILLREIGAEFTLDKVDRKTKIAESGVDYNAVNPKSYVPTIQNDGLTLTENIAIAMYLADQKGGEKVAPKAGTKERIQMLEWLAFISTEVHKNFSPLFRKTPDPAVREILLKRLALIEKHLATHQFLLGDRFSAPDAYLFAVLRWAPHVQIERTPNLEAYFQRIRARPAVMEALKVEKLPESLS